MKTPSLQKVLSQIKPIDAHVARYKFTEVVHQMKSPSECRLIAISTIKKNYNQ